LPGPEVGRLVDSSWLVGSRWALKGITIVPRCLALLPGCRWGLATNSRAAAYQAETDCRSFLGSELLGNVLDRKVMFGWVSCSCAAAGQLGGHRRAGKAKLAI